MQMNTSTITEFCKDLCRKTTHRCAFNLNVTIATGVCAGERVGNEAAHHSHLQECGLFPS